MLVVLDSLKGRQGELMSIVGEPHRLTPVMTELYMQVYKTLTVEQSCMYFMPTPSQGEVEASLIMKEC